MYKKSQHIQGAVYYTVSLLAYNRGYVSDSSNSRGRNGKAN